MRMKEKNWIPACARMSGVRGSTCNHPRAAAFAGLAPSWKNRL
jgi:hypothetical protein